MKKSWLWLPIVGFAAVVLLGTIVGMIGCTSNIETNIENVNLPGGGPTTTLAPVVPPGSGEGRDGGSEEFPDTTTTLAPPLPPEGGYEGAHEEEFPTTTTIPTTTTTTLPSNDLNGDGFADIIVGAPGASAIGGVANTGQAYVFFGEDVEFGGGWSVDYTMTGVSGGDSFGRSVCLSDLNGDGTPEVIVGAADVGDDGVVYIYDGTDDFSSPVLTLEEPSIGGADAEFGRTLASGDLNGDGYKDLIVGAFEAGGGLREGAVYIYYGGAAFDVAMQTRDVLMVGADINEGRHYGFSLAVGDVNGDGVDDLAVGSPTSGQGAEGGGTGGAGGRVYLYYGSKSGFDGMVDETLSENFTTEWRDMPGRGSVPFHFGDYFGYAVCMGDVNGDGRDELMASFYDDCNDDTDATGDLGIADADGAVYVYSYDSAASALNHSYNLKITQATNEGFGYSIASFNFDGDAANIEEIIVGAPGTDRLSAGGAAQTNNGTVYVYYGASGAVASIDTSADLVLHVDGNNIRFGASVSPAGDVNHDGDTDLFVGAPGTLGSTGMARIYYGGAGIDDNFDASLAAGGGRFGYSGAGVK